MDIFVWFWIIYVVGSFFFSIYARFKAMENQKSKSFQSDDAQELKKPELTKAEASRRNSDIQRNNQRAQQLRRNHRARLNNQNKLKDTSLEDLKNSLQSVRETKQLSFEPEYSEGQAADEFYESEEFHQSSDLFDESSEYFEAELKSAENHLNELEKWYSDHSIEDASWMELDDEDILLETPSPQLITAQTKHKHPIQKAFANKESLRNYMIFNEVINKPKSLRRGNE